MTTPYRFIDSWRHIWNYTGFNPFHHGADDGFGNLISIWGKSGHSAAHTFLYDGMFGFDCGMNHPTDQSI